MTYNAKLFAMSHCPMRRASPNMKVILGVCGYYNFPFHILFAISHSVLYTLVSLLCLTVHSHMKRYRSSIQRYFHLICSSWVLGLHRPLWRYQPGHLVRHHILIPFLLILPLYTLNKFILIHSYSMSKPS